jgi:hypothetical protein
VRIRIKNSQNKEAIGELLEIHKDFQSYVNKVEDDATDDNKEKMEFKQLELYYMLGEVLENLGEFPKAIKIY